MPLEDKQAHASPGGWVWSSAKSGGCNFSKGKYLRFCRTIRLRPRGRRFESSRPDHYSKPKNSVCWVLPYGVNYREFRIAFSSGVALVLHHQTNFNQVSFIQMPSRREPSFTVTSASQERIPLLLVVYRYAFELLALRIGSARSHGAGFAIGRHDNSPRDSDLSTFLDG